MEESKYPRDEISLTSCHCQEYSQFLVTKYPIYVKSFVAQLVPFVVFDGDISGSNSFVIT